MHKKCKIEQLKSNGMHCILVEILNFAVKSASYEYALFTP